MIDAKDCAFSWGFRVKENQQQGNKRAYVDIEEVSKPVIRNLNFKLAYNDLMIIVGAVGSGKTTLLHSIMEETKTCEGKIDLKGTIAYVEQEPFIFSGSIKDNILFGKKLDQEMLNKAIEVSQLIHDIEKFE